VTFEQGIIIDGITFDIPLIDLKRSVEFLDKYAERTTDGVLKRELIGVYINYQLTVGLVNDMVTYNKLFDKLSEPIEFHTVTLPSSTGSYTFTAYIAELSDNAYRIYKKQNHFSGLSCSFIAKRPARS
jgi:hypothetical protein